MKWVTRENANVDRIACPWLIRRFIDKDAEFLYVPRDEVWRPPAGKARIPTTHRAPSTPTGTASAHSTC